MNLSEGQVQKLLTTNKQFQFTQLGFSLLVTRMRGMYAKDPSALRKYTQEINAFIKKFESIMQSDFKTATQL